MPAEVNKYIFRGSNSAILYFATLVSGVQLILKVQNLPLTLLWKGFDNWEEKEEVNKMLFPFCENGRKKAIWFTQTTTLIKL